MTAHKNDGIREIQFFSLKFVRNMIQLVIMLTTMLD